jgi:hypothetical protein
MEPPAICGPRATQTLEAAIMSGVIHDLSTVSEVLKISSSMISAIATTVIALRKIRHVKGSRVRRVKAEEVEK